ncbi:hypothetical protein BDV25DRAFT_171368 [Aspergillus avenaceus]|uniref:Carrier domain-containing protein n=1 Tax=Aspergillus avenaceus TaxID=36643 RepID=A0A5N6TEK8_ASPAV|nr:hypothetical protein BDV25DRAFT_171368 [Aspergillus avenaceus]
MENLLCQKANAFPNAIALIDEHRSLTYQELIMRADLLSQQLDRRPLGSQEPVCIFLGPGIDQIIAQVAVLRAGGTCVPIEPSIPDMRLDDMLNDIDCKRVITRNASAHIASNYEVLSVEIAKEDVHLGKDRTIPVLAGAPENHRSHILFTSGSTGKPKAVQISASSIMHLATSTPVTPLEPTDRSTALVNPGFDLSLFEIWVTLLSGSTIVTIPKTVATDPFTLTSYLKDHKVTVSILPTALFNVIALHSPSAFSGLRHVLAIGEAANVSAMRQVLTHDAPQFLWNAYGPTETTTFSSIKLVDMDEAQRERIGIGEAVGQTKFYLLDGQSKPITGTDEAGEICIAGPGLSQGYLNRPEANKERFISLKSAPLDGSAPPVRVYRTGDIGKWRVPSQSLDYVGRADKQIKRSGYRIELGDIERTLEQNPCIKANAVLHQKPQDVTGPDILLAYVLPEIWEDFRPGDIINWARERLPPYMVPDRIKPLKEFPLTPYGKINRSELSLIDQERPPRYERNEFRNGRKNYHDVNTNDNYFALGLTSLQAAQFIGQIRRRMGKSVTMEALHANPTLEQLMDFLHQDSNFDGVPIQTSRLENDSYLADDIPLLPDWQADTEGRDFITGVTGFVGAYLLTCLARGRDGLSASHRIQKTLERYDLWDDSLGKMQKMIILDGDLANDTFALTEDKFNLIANWASVVFHVAAKVNWCEPYESHFDSNIIGTKNILRLVVSGRRKTLHYVSSIDVWSVTGLVFGTEKVAEDESLEPHLGSTPYDTGYAQSQWVAEQMVQRTRDRGLPVAIYRPGFVIGDSKRAAGNPDDFFSRLIVGCIQLGYWPDLPSQRLEYVTVDYNHNLGRCYSLVSPDVSQSVNLEKTCKLLNEAVFQVKQIPYQDWVQEVRDTGNGPLLPLMPMLEEPILRGLTRFQTTQALADRPDIRYVPLDHSLLRRKVKYWLRKGFYTLN